MGQVAGKYGGTIIGDEGKDLDVVHCEPQCNHSLVFTLTMACAGPTTARSVARKNALHVR
jgi:N-acetylglutamate synthase/N-acetylornithine aminotransferase